MKEVLRDYWPDGVERRGHVPGMGRWLLVEFRGDPVYAWSAGVIVLLCLAWLGARVGLLIMGVSP